MQDVIIVVAVLVVWVILSVWVLPKMGIST